MRPSPEELIAAGQDGIRRNARGHITEWRGSDGKFRPVVELRRHAKGKRRPTAAEDSVEAARHLSLRGVGTLPAAWPRDSRYGSDGKEYWRLRHAYLLLAINDGNDARRLEIDRMGIGARVPFAQARANAGLPPAERCPTALAWRLDWLGSHVASNPKASQAGVEGGHSAVENATIAGIDNPRVDAALGEYAEILDLSLFGLTAREIASRKGWGSTKGAEERAVRAQDTALAALAKIAA